MKDENSSSEKSHRLEMASMKAIGFTEVRFASTKAELAALKTELAAAKAELTTVKGQFTKALEIRSVAVPFARSLPSEILDHSSDDTRRYRLRITGPEGIEKYTITVQKGRVRLFDYLGIEQLRNMNKEVQSLHSILSNDPIIGEGQQMADLKAKLADAWTQPHSKFKPWMKKSLRWFLSFGR